MYSNFPLQIPKEIIENIIVPYYLPPYRTHYDWVIREINLKNLMWNDVMNFGLNNIDYRSRLQHFKSNLIDPDNDEFEYPGWASHGHEQLLETIKGFDKEALMQVNWCKNTRWMHLRTHRISNKYNINYSIHYYDGKLSTRTYN